MGRKNKRRAFRRKPPIALPEAQKPTAPVCESESAAGTQFESLVVHDPLVATTPEKAPSDPTKTKSFAFTDLLIKFAAMVSVATIGISSCQFQRSNVDKAEAYKLQEKEDQRFLPMFDGLLSLEFTLDDFLSQNLSSPASSLEVGETLLWLNASLYMPVNSTLPVRIPAYSEILQRANSPMGIYSQKGPPLLSELPLKTALAVTAQMYRIAAAQTRLTDPGARGMAMTLTIEPGVLRVDGVYGEGEPPPLEDGRLWVGPTIELNIDAESEAALRRWIRKNDTTRTSHQQDLYFDIGAIHSIGRELILALRLEVARVRQETLSQHPALGEKYLTVRSNLLANKSYRRAPTTVGLNFQELEPLRHYQPKPYATPATSPVR